MNKLFLSVCITLLLSFGVFPQSTDDYNKNEFFVGYVGRAVERERSSKGFEGAYARNIHQYVGLKASFSSTFDTTNFGSTSEKFSITTHRLVGGIQVKNNQSDNRLKPFAHFLVGAGSRETKFSSTTNPSIFSDTGFVTNVGGGLDIKINKRFDIRTQVDLEFLRVKETPTTPREFERIDSVGFAVGIVIK